MQPVSQSSPPVDREGARDSALAQRNLMRDYCPGWFGVVMGTGVVHVAAMTTPSGPRRHPVAGAPCDMLPGAVLVLVVVAGRTLWALRTGEAFGPAVTSPAK